MKRLHFSKSINAPREKVWNTLIGPESYKAWTAPFMEGSYYEGSWNKGDKHLGEVKNGVDDFDSEDARKWALAFENYTLTNVNGSTEVGIDIDVAPDFESYMKEKWPVALDTLKSLSEAP